MMHLISEQNFPVSELIQPGIKIYTNSCADNADI